MKPFKMLLSFLLWNLLISSQAADLVTTTTQVQDEIEDDVIVSVNAGARTYRPYTAVPSGGNGSTSDQPFVTYLAYQNSVKTSAWEQFTLGDGLTSNNGPIFIGSSSPGAQSITLPIEIDADGRRSLFAAVKDTADTTGATWVIIKISDRVTSEAQNDLETTISFDPNSICLTYLASQCSNIASGTSDRQTLNLFFFLADNGDNDNTLSLGNEIDPATYSGKGLFWDLKLSARMPTFSSGSTISIGEVRRGDKRILLDYSIPSSITDFKEIVVIYQIQNSDPAPSTDLLFSDIAGALTEEKVSFDDYGTTLEGTLTLKNLVNNETYDAYLGVVDYYYFAPKFSTKGSGTTAAIEELLKEQNCFFLTAGFGEDHPVIRGFRYFRDHYLLKTTFGKIFVSLYYKIAPLWAPILYKYDSLRFIVRIWSSTLYQMVTYSLWFFLGFIPFLAIFSAFRFRKKSPLFFLR